MSDPRDPREAGDRGAQIAALDPERQKLLARLLAEREGRSATHRPTPAQERLHFLERLTAGRSLYWMPAAVRLVGALDRAAVAAALAALVERHEALRTVFVEVDGRTVASVRGAAEMTAPPETVDLADLADPLAALEVADGLASELASRAADLASGPLVRSLLARLGEDDHLLVVVVHHIAADGWSLGLMVDELARDLAARAGEGEPPAAPPLQYRAYARWLEERLESPELARELSAWTERLAGDLPTLAPLADRPEAPARGDRGDRSHRGESVPVAVAAETADAVDRLARERGASPFAVLLAAWGATLGRLAGEDDVAVATPVANRPRSELSRVVGLFVNMVVLRLGVDPDAPATALVERARRVTTEALAGAEVPFERLVAALAPERRLGTHPLAQVMLALQEQPPPVPDLPGLTVHRRPVRSGVAKLDLTLDLERRDGGLVGELEIDRDLYDRATGERLAEVWSTVLSALVATPEIPVAELPLLSDAARRAVLASGGEAAPEAPSEGDGFEPLPAVWRRRAVERPDAVAAVAGGESVTYGRLARRAAAVAAVLAERTADVGPEPRVVLPWGAGAPGLDLLTCLWGALDAGVAYVPLDPSLPAARRREILTQSGARLAVGSRAALEALPDGVDGVDGVDIEVLALEEMDELADPAPETAIPRQIHPATAASAAYVLFTSGSTGRPKGVVVPHGALAVHTRAVAEAFRLSPDDRVLRTASPAFDVAVEEIFPTWSVGATVVGPAAGAEAVVPGELSSLVDELGVTVANLPGSLWHEWVAALADGDTAGADPWPESLRLVVTGSEAVSPAAARRWWQLGGPPLANAYGLTEATVTSLLGPVDHMPPEAAPRLPVGRALPGVTVHVVDRWGRLLPDGAPGELRLGGGALARGYLDRPAETAAAFLPDPFSPHPGARQLATGDRARRNGDGEIEILGRLDDQVKVRGFRIEPGEVEAALASVAGVAEAAVVAAGTGAGRRLVGFWTASAEGETPSEETLLAELGRRLPRPLVPARLVRLERLPTTASDKVDRRQLARRAEELDTAGFGDGDGSGPGARALTPTEELVAGVLGELLERSGLAPESDFFELGGHSLLAGQAASRLGDALGVPVAVAELFERPTVAGLARLAEERRSGGAALAREPIPATPADAGPHPLSPSQERFWLLERLAPGSPRYAIPAALDLDGSLDGSLDLGALARALGSLVERHEVLRSRFVLGESGPEQVVLDLDGPLALPVVDVSGLPEDVRETETAHLSAVLAGRGFDLETPPHLAAALLRQGPERHRLVLSVHHIAADGWSFGLLVDELGALLAGRELPDPSLQFRDYARWQRRFLEGPAADAQLEHWRGRLAPLTEGATGAFELDGDRPRPPLESFRGDSETFRLDPDLAAGLERLARRRGGTLFVGLSGLVGSLLSRWTGMGSGVLGTPVADRHALETRGLVGPALNLLPVAVDASGDGLSLDHLLGRLAPRWLDDYAHRDLPFERLVDELVPDRDLARAPLFQILLVLQNAPLGTLDLGDVTATPVPVATGAARYDLALSFDRSLDRPLDRAGGGLELTVERSTALYDAATVARLVRSLETFWRAAMDFPRRPLASLPLLAPAEQHQVLREWQGATVSRRRPATVPGQLAEQIRRTPDRPALTVPGTGGRGAVAWTYRQLSSRVAALARRLEDRGVGRGDLVAIALPRSAEMVVALLAVMEAGAAYLPLDPDYPAGRLAQIVADARPVLALVAPGAAAPGELPSLELSVEYLEDGADQALGDGPADGDDLAYLLYTSGSTGRPKGVAVTHGNATAFFAAMDPVLGVAHDPGGDGDEEPPATFLATTSISFDISVLELLWSLARGFHLVVHPGSGAAGLLAGSAENAPARTGAPVHPSLAPTGSPELALLYFADDASGTPGRERYRLLLDGARRGDQLGFSAVWTPERHFHAFGGLYPNPSVVAAALAATTERIALRAGSVVVPLHQPVRVAEEWAVVDNLSDGRVGISFASGWHPRDFTLAPGSFEERKETMLDSIDQVRRLWRGETVELPDGRGEPVGIEIHPRPVQPELPVWLTAAGNPETFRQAGSMGAGVLTHLLAQTEQELTDKIAVYRAASRAAGYGDGSVTLMLHTFVGEDAGDVRETVRLPLTAYLASSLDLVRGPAEEMGLDPEDLSDDDRRLLLDAAFERYYRGSGLFGTPREAAATLERMTALGVDEIGCLVDFGVATDDALGALSSLARLLPARSVPVRRTGDASESAGDVSLAALVERFRVTHLQSTPSLARLILADAASRRALGRLDHLVLGGEPLPVPLAEELQAATADSGTAVHDLYGPTETTVWSSAHRLTSPLEPVGPSRSVSVGRPVAGERVHLVDRGLRPVPPGVTGEVAIGGAGVARGYLGRPAATAAVFVPDSFARASGARLYLTGDLGRHRPDGRLELLGRRDQQVKVGGHRIELGEIEATLAAHPRVREAAVVAGPEGGLAAFVVAAGVAAGEDGVGEVARAARVPALPRAVDEAGAAEILAGLERFHLPNGMEVAHLGDLHTRVGYEEIFENDSYFRHGLAVADGDTVLDVGANIGFFTLALHQRCRPGRVLAFEPIPATHRALAANVALYGLDAVETVHAGVGADNDTVAFTFYPGMDGLSGRYADPEADRAATRAIIVERMEAEGMALSDADLEAFLDRQFESERHVCPVVPLSDVIAERGIERIDLLKVDVERAEVDVLRGLGDDGWAAVRQAVLEVDTAENLTVVEAMFREHGFDVQTDELVTVDGPVEDGAGEAQVEVWMVYASRDGLERQESPGPVNRQALREARPAERPTRDDLAAHLAERLPAAMVPGRIDWLDRLPQTPNGKVDKKALAERARRPQVPGTSNPEVSGTPENGPRRAPGSGPPPATGAERAVAEVWSRVLGVERVGRDDNFFEVGGNSLLLARVHGELGARFGREVPMLELFRKPTVASLAAFLADEPETDRGAEEPSEDSHEDLPKTVERQRRFMAERRRRRNRR